MKRLFIVSTIIFTTLIIGGCSTQHNDSASREPESGKSNTPTQWSYKGETGPENWHLLSEEFKDCAGTHQSPINIITSETKEANTKQPLQINYDVVKVKVKNTGKTVKAYIDNNENNYTSLIDGKEYTLLQFHFHTPSEHKVDNKSFPAELHFVHQNNDSLAVIGVFIVEGDHNPELDKLLSALNGDQHSNSINVLNLMPQNLSYYHYKGSLTTPPCSEIVNWYVLIHPIEASKDQLENLHQIMGGNARPTMPLNNRTVWRCLYC